MARFRFLTACVLMLFPPFAVPGLGAEVPAHEEDFRLVQAEDRTLCSVNGRVETHRYPRSVGRQIAMLYPGSRLTTATELGNVSVILPPIFESPGPRYGNFLSCRLRVRVDAQP